MVFFVVFVGWGRGGLGSGVGIRHEGVSPTERKGSVEWAVCRGGGVGIGMGVSLTQEGKRVGGF